MKILIVPCAYKGTLSASALARAIASGVRLRYPEGTAICAPIADGGDSTIEAIHLAVGGELKRVSVHGPVGNLHEAYWLRVGDIAIVELACASGLGLLDANSLAPLGAHTLGLGEVMQQCLDCGLRKIVVCVGGSASTDGGAGMLTALGAKFTNAAGEELPLGGGALSELVGCDLSALGGWVGVDVSVAVDVENPLLGLTGAAHIFGPQKGADPDQVLFLDLALARFADVLEHATGRLVRDQAGCGAAGGTAFGLACGLGAQVISGFDWIANLLNLKERIAEADIVITAEGRLDTQSLQGKAIGGLAKMCLEAGRPLLAVPALLESGVDWAAHGLARAVASAGPQDPATLDDVTAATVRLLS